ncbi:transketolase C-terminal domain-containing protein, partial [Aeromicrobium sp.]|uniref:transketolase C-terminal domain-containing protein n=1 Tax=Aeromicrobium sp. TaxID=1871063 RepID=UPI003C58DB0E
GMAMGGLHPVVAVYATFLNRAFDQVLLDVALHRCGVTFVLDRAGVTGEDGPSHNGMWDMSLLQLVPHLRLAAPRDGNQLRELLREAVDVDDAPTVVRFAKGAVGPDVPAIERLGHADVLALDDVPDVFVLAVGSLAQVALDAAEIARQSGLGVTVVDPRWVKPFDPAVVEMAAQHRLVVTVEDNGRQGGVGAAFTQALRDAGSDVLVQIHAIEQEFLDHAKRDVILTRLGLTPEAIADDIVVASRRNKPDE